MMRKEEIFTQKWHYTEKYVSLSLQKLQVEYRIYPKNDGYEVRCKYTQERPYILGKYHSLREAQYCVYATLMQCIIYKDEKYYIQYTRKTDV